VTVRHTLVVLAALLLSALCHADEPPMNPVAQEGARLYEYYCRSCHGEKGAGDGPTAEVLTVSPANLTALAEANDGKFPLERVTRTIDGRDRSPAHGQEMPIWGLGFQDPSSDSNQEEEVQRRISALVAYLKTLQR
jgi:mono/diheme cytochrome c family protein